MIKSVLVLALVLFTGPVWAQETQAALLEAEARLAEAEGNLQRRRALTRAIRSYENALLDLGGQMDKVARDMRSKDRAIAAEEEVLARLLAALARVGMRAEPLVLTGAGATAKDAVRAAVVLESLAGRARVKAQELQADKAALAALQKEQLALRSSMRDSRARLSDIRTLLMAQTEATDPLPDIGEDAANLAALAIALESVVPADASGLTTLDGPLAPPVPGTIVRGFGQRDAAGLTRPGLTIAAPPGALVTSPVSATVRFVGQLDGYGSVVILEPDADVLLVLGGLDGALVRAGEGVEPGRGLGFLPGDAADHEKFLMDDGDGSGQHGAKTLYIELRHNQQPIDPQGWFDGYR